VQVELASPKFVYRYRYRYSTGTVPVQQFLVEKLLGDRHKTEVFPHLNEQVSERGN
jgi:hypothetical protein